MTGKYKIKVNTYFLKKTKQNKTQQSRVEKNIKNQNKDCT